jgi:hypothetical protein
VKPDCGVGAADTFRIADAETLARCAASPPRDAVVQPFVPGTIATFDGLTDADGRIVFFTSFAYCAGVLAIVEEQRDVFYYATREIPRTLEAYGRRAVAAFGLRERFFHLEFLVPQPGEFVTLEMNLRPPGGFTTDLMNYACDVDVYDLWARVIARDDLASFTYERKYFAAHVSRRNRHRYRYTHDEVVERLGARLVLSRAMPPPFDHAMGDTLYLVRTSDRAGLDDAVSIVHARA